MNFDELADAALIALANAKPGEAHDILVMYLSAAYLDGLGDTQ